MTVGSIAMSHETVMGLTLVLLFMCGYGLRSWTGARRKRRHRRMSYYG